ncbi:hypothetical protein D3C85_1700420 [compost metagenome]
MERSAMLTSHVVSQENATNGLHRFSREVQDQHLLHVALSGQVGVVITVEEHKATSE